MYRDGTPNPNQTLARTRAGAEPGINPRRDSTFEHYGYIKQECVIDITDYSSERIVFRRVGNEDFVQMMGGTTDEEKEQRAGHEKWVGVRWINIGGTSWDVLSALALKYSLFSFTSRLLFSRLCTPWLFDRLLDVHSLALDDVLHAQGYNLSKADYYQSHLFLRILCHSLASDDDNACTSHVYDPISEFPRTSSPTAMTQDEIERRHDEGEDENEDDEKPNKQTAFRRIFTRHVLGDIEAQKPKRVQRSDLIRRLSFSHLTVMRAEVSLSLLISPSPWLTSTPPQARHQQILKIQALTKGERVNVSHAPMFIFLFRDGASMSHTCHAFI